MHGADATGLELAFEAEVEVGRIDADEHVRAPVDKARTQPASKRQQPRQVREHFAEAHHCQLAGVVPGVDAGVAHRIAADACEPGIRETRPQAVDQSRAEQVARGLAGHQREARRARAHRSSGRSPASMKSSMRRTSSLSTAIAASLARASSRLSPDMYTAR